MENSTEVLKAVISGDAAQLNEILQSLNSTERVSVLAAQDYTDEALEGANVNAIPCKTTPLIVAVQSGNLDCVKVLLNYKADIEEQGESFIDCYNELDKLWDYSESALPLFFAAGTGHLDILSYLFEQGANVNASSSSDDFWSTPLIVALITGHIDAFTFLIDKGADVNLQDHQGYTALHHAVKSENFDALSCLVHNGADVNLFTSYEHSTPLMLACQSYFLNMDAINFLLNKGADVNLQDHKGYTALHHAVKSENFDALSCLVHNGADVNLFTSYEHSTPLMLACQSYFLNMDAINFLLNKGADVNLQDHEGYTALHHAVESEKFDAISCLVHNGADVNLQDRNGQSALHFASSDICCSRLIQNLADVNMGDNDNCTPLMHASWNSNVKKVAMLIENGAKVDLQDMNGNTALHHAVLDSYHFLYIERITDICLALLTAKASHLCNSQGWTPLLLASENCIESLVEILLKQPEITKEQRANALELLGASLCVKSGTFAHIKEGFSYIKLGMKERFVDASHPLLKQQVEPAEAYQNRRECQTVEELAEIEGDRDAIIMESLVIRERIIGANSVELLEPIEHVAGHFYSKDPGHFKRLSIPLYRYATKIAQGCIEECFDSVVSCLWYLTDLLYECKQYSDKELLLELLELTVFLCENWPDDDGYYQSFWHITHFGEGVSLFDSVEVVIHMITKNLQNGEEDETYSNVLVLLRRLLRHNPRCMNYNGTLLHIRIRSTEEIITDIFPSADTVKLLLNAGFNVNATDCNGDTPLHVAASLQSGDELIHQVPEIMKALFYGGAHHDFVNNDGKTPMDMAQTDEARMILSERRKLELKCISARAVKKFGIPYLGVVPKILEKYVSMH